MVSAQVVETSVTNNSPFQDSYHPDDLFQSRYATPGFKPFSYLVFLTVLGPGYKNASVQFRNIDLGLLEQRKDESGKEHEVHLGSVVFGCCSKMLLLL